MEKIRLFLRVICSEPLSETTESESYKWCHSLVMMGIFMGFLVQIVETVEVIGGDYLWQVCFVWCRAR